MVGDNDVDEALLADFTRQGRFAQSTKTDVTAWEPDRREHVALLDDWSQALVPYDLGFGYRGVNEVLTFMGMLRTSPLQSVLSEDEAFDMAMRMKVLPKFHGPFNRLKPRLEAVIACAWERCEGMGLSAEQMLEKAKDSGADEVLLANSVSRESRRVQPYGRTLLLSHPSATPPRLNHFCNAG